jgi:hypothetical protein
MTWWYCKLSGIEPGPSLPLELTNGPAHAAGAIPSLDPKT